MLRRAVWEIFFKVREPDRRIFEGPIRVENKTVLLQRFRPLPQLFERSSQKVAHAEMLLA